MLLVEVLNAFLPLAYKMAIIFIVIFLLRFVIRLIRCDDISLSSIFRDIFSPDKEKDEKPKSKVNLKNKPAESDSGFEWHYKEE